MKIQWTEDVTITIVTACEDEQVEDYDEICYGDTIDEVDIVSENETHADLQFGDGSMAYGVFKGYYREFK